MLYNKCLVASYCRSKNSRFVANKNGCYLCWSNLSDTSAYQSHTKLHLENVKVATFNASWKSLGSLELIGFNITVDRTDFALKLKNNSDSIIKISHVTVYNTNSTFDLVSPGDVVLLQADGEVKVKGDLKELCNHNHIAIIYETTVSNNVSEAVQSYHVQRKEEAKEHLEGKIELLTVTSSKTPCDPVRSNNNRGLELGKLSNYTPSVEIKSLYNIQFQSNPALTANEEKILKTITQFKGPLTSSNYFTMLTLMVQIEDYGAQVSVLRSTKRNRCLVKVKGNEYALQLHEREGRPLFLLAGDQIWIGKGQFDSRIYGFVQRLQRLALDAAKRLDIIDLLFPQPNQLNLLSEPTIPELNFHNKRLKSDADQSEAVHQIVAGTAYPFPYVLIGFPGTGKTATIVESIYQLWKINEKNRILVCAQSNSVCDEIGQRLLASIPTKGDQQYNILRLFATSVRKSCKNVDLRDISNFDERCIPCLAELYKYRIIIATLTVSGRLLQANMDSNHFTHLFIDECESATESFTLLPIALCSSMKKINAHVVLSGDPNQLGPVVRHSIAKGMTMDVSMLKRLSSSPLYQNKANKTRSYDRRITCRLRNNYRSHPDLVDMPNALFYNNEMKCCIPNIDKIQWLSELDFLPKKVFPILFEHVEGIPETKENCSSWFNDTEKESVLHYIEKLLHNEPQQIKQSDIGIIAAYKRQVIHIMECLEERNYSGIEVGTVEQFQGREKPIIIISTVRNGSMGFLQQRERINVLLTRAIGLLIIIGHAKTLHKNSDWRKVIDYTSTKCGGEIVADYGDYNVGDYRC